MVNKNDTGTRGLQLNTKDAFFPITWKKAKNVSFHKPHKDLTFLNNYIK